MASSSDRVITQAELDARGAGDDVWIVIDGDVYDMTKFKKVHPGGEFPLEDVKGRDVTMQFHMLHDKKILAKTGAKFKIGKFQPGPPAKKDESKPPGLGPTPPLVASDKPSFYSGGTAHILPAERQKASFEVDKMSAALYGGPEAVVRRRFILHPTTASSVGSAKYDMSREDLMEKHVGEFISIHRPFTLEGYRPGTNEVAWMSEGATNSGSMMPHYGLFLPTIMGQGSDQQVAAWLPRALVFKIVGSYAQTELGHGSNVRGLQTTATFDPETGDFILDTPTLGATKWWNSNAGIVATHGAVYAQLIIHGKEYGVHVFFVQLRDENHDFLPGIKAGDVGTKMGDNGIDTSWIQFQKVRVPRAHLMAKRQHVTRSGKYVKHNSGAKGGGQAHYLTMMQARSGMSQIAAGKLSIACTIAARYSAVRVQGFIDASAGTSFLSKERTILDHQYQRYRVCKQIANSYSMRANGRWMAEKMTVLQQAATSKEGTLIDDMPEIHASAAGLKGLFTKMCADGIEDLRKCCGGHGFLLNSGISLLANDYVWQVTAEGDFVVMLLQTARYLLKSLHAARRGEKLSGLTECLAPLRDKGFNPLKDGRPRVANTATQARDLDHIMELFKYRVLVALDRVGAQFDSQMARPNANFEDAFNACALSLVATAQSHCMYFSLRNFIDVVRKQTDPAVGKVMGDLAALFGLSEVLDGRQWGGLLDAQEITSVEMAVAELLDDLRPDVVALVDAFDWPDAVLNSTLGRFDGNVYEALFDAAWNAPLNTGRPFKGYEHLSRALDKEFLALRGKACEEVMPDEEEDAKL